MGVCVGVCGVHGSAWECERHVAACALAAAPRLPKSHSSVSLFAIIYYFIYYFTYYFIYYFI
jgi:hypothetical protein